MSCHHLVACPSCGRHTEVTEEVHHGVPLDGWTVGCWACGEPVTVPPTRQTVEAAARARVLLGVATVACGDVERGKAILRDA